MIREMKKIIKQQIDEISELAFDVIPVEKIYPHVVATITMDIYNAGLHNMQIDFDVWDLNTSTENIDVISEKIIDKLNGFKYTDRNMNFVMYFASSNYIQDTNKELRRKTCTFEVQARKGK
ncbi:hypothetical protein [Helcococcus kunzii]|uniref:hypothetical protein n=1 Tax=Helcococcus kunzii TaxID=40091 RepID=UPI001BB04BBA|nr:hypothetical protein [Helcococcus kunzii]QUY64292.1 hypothetical protein GUI37_01665 [Helcococcus kunzii]